MWAFISSCAFSDAVLQMHAFNAWQSPNVPAHKWGGGGGPPWGEFNGIDAENVLFFYIDFFASSPRFGRLLGFQIGDTSAALLAAPGVLNPTAFFSALKYCMLKRRSVGNLIEFRPGPCWGYVGPMLAHFSLLGAS